MRTCCVPNVICSPDNEHLLDEAASFIKDTGAVTAGTVRWHDTFAAAMAAGDTVMEMRPEGGAACDIAAIWANLRKMLGATD